MEREGKVVAGDKDHLTSGEPGGCQLENRDPKNWYDEQDKLYPPLGYLGRVMVIMVVLHQYPGRYRDLISPG